MSWKNFNRATRILDEIVVKIFMVTFWVALITWGLSELVGWTNTLIILAGSFIGGTTFFIWLLYWLFDDMVEKRIEELLQLEENYQLSKQQLDR